MTPGRYEVAPVVDGRARWETPACRCRHVEYVHGFARRAGVTVRAACNAADPKPCTCRLYEQPTMSGEAPGG